MPRDRGMPSRLRIYLRLSVTSAQAKALLFIVLILGNLYVQAACCVLDGPHEGSETGHHVHETIVGEQSIPNNGYDISDFTQEMCSTTAVCLALTGSLANFFDDSDRKFLDINPLAYRDPDLPRWQRPPIRSYPN